VPVLGAIAYEGAAIGGVTQQATATSGAVLFEATREVTVSEAPHAPTSRRAVRPR
jgi:hypothetical protein